MKKKEILTIFVLAGLLTTVNFLNNYYNSWHIACITAQGPGNWWNSPIQIIGNNFLGKILLKSPSCFKTESGLVCPTMFVGPGYCRILGAALFFFWLLVLLFGYQVIKYILKKKKKNI